MAGQQFEYDYDQIGNRLFSRGGGDQNGGDLRETEYSVNDLNQYTERTVPEYVDVIGAAPANKTVRVGGTSAGVTRHGEYFRKEIAESNTGSAQYPAVTVDITDGVATSPEIDGNIFIPKTPEDYVHDADGNLTQDGRRVGRRGSA